jgi:hypothetical protein
MIKVATIAARLMSLVPELARVAGVSDLAAAKGNVTQLPAAYIMPEPERAKPNKLMGGHSQELIERFTILLLVKNVSDYGGMAAQEEVEALSAKVRAAMLGWQPTPEHSPVDLVGAGPLDPTNNLLYWPEGFQASTTIRL